MTQLLAALAGASMTLALAPFNAWWFAPLPLVLLLFFSQKQPTYAFRYALLFFAGYFLSGSSWVYVSMHEHGNLIAPVAGLVTVLFGLVMALLSALPFRLRRLWLGSALRVTLGFASVMMLSEWLRTWILTGFPWLLLGYSQTETLLGAVAPLFGVIGVSGVLCLIAGLLYVSCVYPAQRLIGAISLASILISSALLNNYAWTQANPAQAQTVALVQGNIAQQLRWDAGHRANIKATYLAMSKPLWPNSELVIWPEAAVPELFAGRSDVLDQAFEQALATNSGLITGLPTVNYDAARDSSVFYNSVLGIGHASGIYHKQRLVPFGEYVPFADYVGPLFDLMQVPMSDFRTGPNKQANLQTGKFELAADICYEVAYPVLIAKQVQSAGALLTISNDAWFGSSIGPHQHLQMAQMRARENARPMMRTTNNGITAFIDVKGRIEQRAPQFEAAILAQTVTPYVGTTPFQRWLHWPLLGLIGLGLFSFRKPSTT